MRGLIWLEVGGTEVSVTKLQQIWENFWPDASRFLIRLAIALLIFIIGKKVIKVILNLVRKGFNRAKVEDGVESFTLSLLKILLYVVVLSIIAETLGMPTTSFVAVLGSAGLTIGLALQGSLSNFAGGVLILVLKPFRVGDFIIVNGNEGTVTSIDIFYTKILTVDNRVVVLPNGNLSNSDIMNVTNEPVRRLDLVIPIGYQDDIREVKAALYQICEKNELVQKDNSLDVFVSSFGASAIELTIRAWVLKENYLILKSELLENIKYMFDERGFTIPYNQMDITIHQEKM